ncbi:hypothetical protein ABB37_08297 [Leptomonas pyrrhocoris]|uniref:Uncharacterized protein n=1 Tax=Leptomonas pyrrhocoris TaxID=157538 RepID=A0A0N0DS92_LEPPY|nr:hypothetical protein ABB37_08297 [Leptomonas pyrrhocoris]KPA75762.1 hypothetical protein ABB37_08297 [Leptomonas pyrrhocoris]|eukprot:XP_015654201.1 hypothetical protein ABB37_08297 [Leptomonas pyrrhocoris]
MHQRYRTDNVHESLPGGIPPPSPPPPPQRTPPSASLITPRTLSTPPTPRLHCPTAPARSSLRSKRLPQQTPQQQRQHQKKDGDAPVASARAPTCQNDFTSTSEVLSGALSASADGGAAAAAAVQVCTPPLSSSSARWASVATLDLPAAEPSSMTQTGGTTTVATTTQMGGTPSRTFASTTPFASPPPQRQPHASAAAAPSAPSTPLSARRRQWTSPPPSQALLPSWVHAFCDHLSGRLPAPPAQVFRAAPAYAAGARGGGRDGGGEVASLRVEGNESLRSLSPSSPQPPFTRERQLRFTVNNDDDEGTYGRSFPQPAHSSSSSDSTPTHNRTGVVPPFSSSPTSFNGSLYAVDDRRTTADALLCTFASARAVQQRWAAPHLLLSNRTEELSRQATVDVAGSSVSLVAEAADRQVDAPAHASLFGAVRSTPRRRGWRLERAVQPPSLHAMGDDTTEKRARASLYAADQMGKSESLVCPPPTGR